MGGVSKGKSRIARGGRNIPIKLAEIEEGGERSVRIETEKNNEKVQLTDYPK